MKSVLAFCILAFVAQVFTQDATEIISNLNKCTTDKSQINKCFSDFYTALQPHMKPGVKEMDVPSIDPIFIDRADFPEDSALIEGKAYFYNLTVKGVSNYVVKNVEVDVSKQTVTLIISYNTVEVDGKYDFDGNLLVLPVTGEGELRMNMTDISCTITTSVERDGAKLKLTKALVDFNAKNVKFRLENLFGGQEVGEAINNLINDNGGEVIKELKPVLNVKLADAYEATFKNIFNQISPEIFIVT